MNTHLVPKHDALADALVSTLLALLTMRPFTDRAISLTRHAFGRDELLQFQVHQHGQEIEYGSRQAWICVRSRANEYALCFTQAKDLCDLLVVAHPATDPAALVHRRFPANHPTYPLRELYSVCDMLFHYFAGVSDPISPSLSRRTQTARPWV